MTAAALLRTIIESEVYADAASTSPWLAARRDEARALLTPAVPLEMPPTLAPTDETDETADWWIITLRRCGDDEDSLLIVQAATEREAIDTADAQLREMCAIPPVDEDAPDTDETTVFINHVVRCTGQEPEHVRVAP